MDLLIRNLGLNQDIEPCIRPRFSSEEHIKVLLFHAIDCSGGSSKTNVGHLVLAAGTGTATEMNPDLVLIVAAGLFQLANQTDHPVLGLGHGQITKLNPCTRDAALAEITRLHHQACHLKFLLEACHILLGNIGNNQVLFVGPSNPGLPFLAVLLGKVRNDPHLVAPDPASGETDSDPVKPFLDLLLDSHVIAFRVFREDKVRVPLELAVSRPLHLGNKLFRPPVCHEKLETSPRTFIPIPVVPVDHRGEVHDRQDILGP